ncbi:MAG: Coenzyme A disulfide reductase [Candidatus Argoarchaeum ethanivorans]|uniref:Coenzyme A disulfide reductase n=1 Tax=Candidatus Argoarchaeum ethanivorans TaxID=2608793 RepID=A0A811TCH6_9EURY|nr:MAG: Coenzyme A disulfide reductase [Candidatus Argoarchaeum ethanivorans]
MSKTNKLVIIGCGGFGAPAAKMSKRTDPSVDVTLIREEKGGLLVRCATPFISVERATVEASIKSDEMFHDAGVALVDVPATSINRTEKTVTTADGAVYPYDKLILGTGGKAIVPLIHGASLDGVFTIRTSDNAVSIRDWINEKKVKKAVVYGAGAIGLEMASLIAQKGIAVTIVVRSYIGRKLGLDIDVSNELEKHFVQNGVSIRSKEVVTKIIGETEVEAVELSSGDKIETDMVILSIGVHPRIELAAAAGLEIGEYGLEVNEYLQTSDPDIYAGGDMIEYEHLITKKPIPGQIRPNAVIAGRIAAKNALGYQIEFPGLLNSFAIKLFNKTVASIGVTEAIAEEEGINVFATTKTVKTKYAMIEGGKPYSLKLIFDKKTKCVVGSQIIADDEHSIKSIDVIALAIRCNLTALDLTTLRCASQPELSPEASAEPISMGAEDAFKELYSLT